MNWAGAMADSLNEELPDGYFAEEHAHAGARFEIDVATFGDVEPPSSEGSVATQTYAPPTPTLSIPAAFPDEFEVRVYQEEGGSRLVAVVELISPANKDRAAHRRAFATKCAGYLSQGIALIVVDVITSRLANLHAEIMALLGRESGTGLPDHAELYAVAYRPVVRDGNEVVDVWAEPLTVGSDLPTLPLALNAEVCVPIDLESTYMAARSRRRLT